MDLQELFGIQVNIMRQNSEIIKLFKNEKHIRKKFLKNKKNDFRNLIILLNF